MFLTYDSHIGTAGNRGARLRAVSIAAVLGMVVALVLVGPSGTARAATTVGLGTADGFAVLAHSTITNKGPTTITGDVGLHPGTAVTGFNSVTLHGELHVDDDVAEKAKTDLVTAYNDAYGRSPTGTVGTELGGKTLIGGVYDSESGTFGITKTLTLDAQNDPDTVWIFQAASTLTTATASSVSLINGADACNVFWQVGSSATLGTDSSFTGTIMALTSITLNNGATVEGRALARNGAVTMEANTITRDGCMTPTDSSSPSESSSPTESSTPTESGSPTASPSPSEVATPVDSTTGTPDTSTGTPTAAGTPIAPLAAAPPTSGTQQVPEVPTGSVSAGDGSTASDEGPERGIAVLVVLPLFAALVLYATRRHGKA